MTSQMIRIDPELGRMRLCRRCGEWWPYDREFYYIRADGHSSGNCKACHTEQGRERGWWKRTA